MESKGKPVIGRLEVFDRRACEVVKEVGEASIVESGESEIASPYSLVDCNAQRLKSLSDCWALNEDKEQGAVHKVRVKL